MDVTQSVPMNFILTTIGVILVVIAMGIMMVRSAKQSKEKR
jgi:uncharacterized membrane protein